MNYMPIVDQIRKAKGFLEDMATRKNLNELYDLSLLT